jgi:hypothetical protein
MIMGLSQVGKSSLAASMARYWQSQGYTIWYVNLRAVEVSDLETIADRSIVCDVKRMTPQDRAAKLREAIELIKSLESQGKTILIIDEASPWFTSGTVFDDCLDVLMGAIEEQSFDGLKRKTGILLLGTIPPDLPKVKEAKLGQIEVMPIFCHAVSFPDGSTITMDEKDVTALLKLGNIDISRYGVPDENSHRAIFSSGEWFGIDHLNTYRENTIRTQTVAVSPSFQTPRVTFSQPVAQPVAQPARSFDDIEDFDTPVRARASRTAVVGNPGIRKPQAPAAMPIGEDEEDLYCDF